MIDEIDDVHDGDSEPDSADPSAARRFGETIRRLDPAYFGFVMSTGIISIAFRDLGSRVVAETLAAFNVVCYGLLLALFAVKVGLFPGQVVAELRDSSRHWGALTFVVGTNTVGAQLLLFSDRVAVATALWLTTVAVCPLLLYYLFATEIIGTWESDVSERIDGAFLLIIVCMQSLAVLGGLLSDVLPAYAEGIVAVSMAYWGSGYVLYFVVAAIVTYRLLEGRMNPDDWTGPYWILMGAAAITTLAGATLGPRLSSFPPWEPYVQMTIGVTFLAWAIASWWIPLLLALDVWKFVTAGAEGRPPAWVLALPWSRLGFGRRLHSYNPLAWGRVFPMGMYTACTVNLAGVNAFRPLVVVPRYWGWFALLVWLLTLVGTVRAVGRALSRVSPSLRKLTGQI
ncbi:Tellurite resistance protein TehA [Halogranum amylolyticum]|uniref:Tellurite resistance protein TehA n=1 Tax=Halogranum amylolyticum TaxID=660520 RepID=A0A1H8SH20_9EURY|nr:tellurite resistance/C4-dicarboxylate transporter family protein [Halogranum amylolyticum]SEO77598.1 Tellurite resistance protein TehA [Halogranum amylolyticum]